MPQNSNNNIEIIVKIKPEDPKLKIDGFTIRKDVRRVFNSFLNHF